MNVGVIGLGMGREHVRAYSALPDVRVAAVADLDEARLKSCQAEFKVERVLTDYRELLAMPEIEVVSVCLPNFLHAPVVIEALQAGKHVLCEKPMAKTAAEAEAMAKAAREQGRTLALAMNYRFVFSPDSFYLKHLVDQGRLGSVYYVRTQSLRRRTFRRGQKTWFNDKQRSGGGGLIDMGPHMLDLAMWLAGDYSPVSVSGVAKTALMTDTDVDDLASALVRMKGGAAILLESTWASFTRPGLFLTLLGTEGGAMIDFGAGAGRRLTLFSEQEGAFVETTPVDIQLPFQPEATPQEHFLKALREGREPETSAERGLAVMRVLDAVYQSSASGKEVALG